MPPGNPLLLSLTLQELLARDAVQVELIPEKKGLFLKHVEYEVSSQVPAARGGGRRWWRGRAAGKTHSGGQVPQHACPCGRPPAALPALAAGAPRSCLSRRSGGLWSASLGRASLGRSCSAGMSARVGVWTPQNVGSTPRVKCVWLIPQMVLLSLLGAPLKSEFIDARRLAPGLAGRVEPCGICSVYLFVHSPVISVQLGYVLMGAFILYPGD